MSRIARGTLPGRPLPRIAGQCELPGELIAQAGIKLQ
ncbi:MAG: hypothetical protein FD144_2884 [Rhodospirillaceae bacterium]|nr:MAG: hypothetical protein FD144_2884 [Rhodospirillaceae bacterium]